MFASLHSILLICLGACAGALLRWQLGIHFNQTWAWGTLLANYLGCLLMGVLMAYSLQDNSKLLLITGFLGSFTTFSAFSAQIAESILAQKWSDAALTFMLHTVGGLMLTIVACVLVRWLHGFQAA
ncbi:CrcB family protein [Neisseriaceae bacterium B1]